MILKKIQGFKNKFNKYITEISGNFSKGTKTNRFATKGEDF